MFKSPKSRAIATAILSIATLAAAAPATAALKGDAHKVRMTIEKKDGQTVYCVKEGVTGSRVPVKTCLTKEEWTQQGAELSFPKAGADNSSQG